MASSPETSSSDLWSSSCGCSSRYWMSMPNWVPQSPMWWRRTTVSPVNSRISTIAAPITADRRWPTCISLATFGCA